MELQGALKRSVLDKIFFLHEFIKSPKTVGSITPSSSFLAQAMVQPVDWVNTRSIVELGAGTGVFTSCISELKHPQCKALIFEKDDRMRQRLTKHYPDLYYCDCAEELSRNIKELQLANVDCILSGLPFANFPNHLRHRILDNVINSLKPGGIFIAFQYSLQMKQQLEKRFSRVQIRFVALNIPPAFVYYCYK